ncbi:MAG: L-fuculose-phosphate aldolase [Desulfobacterales bacterium]|nr:L-fuculose-phosphate aldolase [Desulfobacterales bacterium]
MKLEAQRRAVVQYGKKMLAAGLTTGTGGNLSLRDPETGLIALTPSGVEYPVITEEDVVLLDPEGAVVDGKRKPSSEAGFHLALYKKRADIGAVVHTHSVYATTLACLHWEIPPVHYLIGFAGKKVPLAPYATFGTEALAEKVADGIADGNAVLLANHGLVAVGVDLASAFSCAEEIELVARIYYQARCAGPPRLIDDAEMDRVIEQFRTYGK